MPLSFASQVTSYAERHVALVSDVAERTLVAVFEHYNQSTASQVLVSARPKYNSLLRMRSRSIMKPYSTTSTFATVDSFLSREELGERSYLIDKSNLLMNDIHCVLGEKSYYQNQLQSQLRTNAQDKQRLYRLVADKSNLLIGLEEQLQREKKQVRLLTDDYLSIKAKSQGQRTHFQKQVELLKRQNQQKLKQLQQKLQNEFELKIKKTIQEADSSCEKKLKSKDQQLEIIRSSRESVGLELQKSQQEYRLLLLNQSSMASEELHNQIRKRDREQRDRYNQDIEYKQNLKKQNQQYKEELNQTMKDMQDLRAQYQETMAQNKQLTATISKLELDVQKQKGHLTKLREDSRRGNDSEMEETLKIVPGSRQSNLLPAMDLQLMSSLQSLKQFLDESLVQILVVFFQKSCSHTGKSKTASFNTFELNISEVKREKRQLSLVIYTSLKLKQLLKQQWPASQQSHSVITLKENFIRTCLDEAESLKNKPSQQLFRLLELISRIRNPMDHSNTLANISDNALYTVYDRIVASSSKTFY